MANPKGRKDIALPDLVSDDSEDAPSTGRGSDRYEKPQKVVVEPHPKPAAVNVVDAINTASINVLGNLLEDLALKQHDAKAYAERVLLRPVPKSKPAIASEKTSSKETPTTKLRMVSHANYDICANCGARYNVDENSNGCKRPNYNNDAWVNTCSDDGEPDEDDWPEAIFLKLETLQPGGSFKSRGIANYMLSALKRSPNPENVHFYSSSGGNAGIAAVHAANFLQRPCTVVVPMSTKEMMVVKIKAAGAQEVLQYGASWKQADTYLREVVMKKAEERGEEAVHVMPFDHPDIWEGNQTMMGEMRAQLAEMGEGAPDVISCSVGGGGMLNGVLQGMESIEAQGSPGWNRTTVLAMETLGADSLAQSLEQGEHITLPAITSQATTLGCVRVADRTYELASKYQASGRVRSVVFTDAEAAMGCWRFADDERIMVELSCGVTVSLCYGGRLKRALGRPVHPDDKVVLIVCGGHGVNTSMIEQWKQEYGDVDARKMMNGHVGNVPSATTAPNGV